MDSGVEGSDALRRGSENRNSPRVPVPATPTKEKCPMVPVPVTGTKRNGSGSGLVIGKRSGLAEDDRGKLKMARTDELGAAQSVLFPTEIPLFTSNSLLSNALQKQKKQQQLRLSLSMAGTSLTSNDGLKGNYQLAGMSSSYHSPTLYARNVGVGSGNNNENIHGGASTGSETPFTASQWMDFEFQGLIFKYLNTHGYLPQNLLLYVRRIYSPSGVGVSGLDLQLSLSSIPRSARSPSFHQGSEPRRCHKTDGKKWRCTRAAVADQKFCERHSSRSRKLVEGQIGLPASGSVTTMATSVQCISASNSLTMAQQQSMRHAADTCSMNISRIAGNALNMGMQDRSVLLMSSSANLRANDQFPTAIQESQFKGSPSLTNTQKGKAIEVGNVHSSPDSQDSQSQLVRCFIDEWPRDQSDHVGITWREVQSDGNQLPISRPGTSSQFPPSSSSSAQELSLLPPKLSSQLNPAGPSQMRAPSNNSAVHKNPRGVNNSSSGTNFMTLKDTFNGNPQLGSSVTDVLQNTKYGHHPTAV